MPGEKTETVWDHSNRAFKGRPSGTFRRLCGLVGGVLWVIGPLGCQFTSFEGKADSRLPDESLQSTFLYLEEPVLLDETQFHGCLTTLAEQLTVLYLRGPERKVSAAELRSLRDIQNRFYRYGVLVVMVDRGDPKRWGKLRRTLVRMRGNFLVAYLRWGEEDFLNSFLPADATGGNQLWIIDEKRDDKLLVPLPVKPSVLAERIEQVLIARSSPLKSEL